MYAMKRRNQIGVRGWRPKKDTQEWARKMKKAQGLYLDARHGDVAVDAAEDLEEGPAGAALLGVGVAELEQLA
jgi:hypothetical protein